jgi:hypothetical protein
MPSRSGVSPKSLYGYWSLEGVTWLNITSDSIYFVDEDGEPVLIELNQCPDCEFIQIFNGPMFGDYTDELMERISKHHLEAITVYKRSFDNGPKQYEYNFEVGKAYSI